MRKYLKITLVLLFIGGLGIIASQASAVEASGVVPFNTIIIGWDGVQRDHFWECYNKELPECPNGLPNIKELSQDVIFNNTITNGGTSTKPGWAQILSGYNAEVTGIYSNTIFQPLPKGFSVLEKLENHFGKDNIVTLFVTGKWGNVGGRCWPGGGQPYCVTKENLDFFQNGLGANHNVGNKAIELLSKFRNDKFFAFIHFRDPDGSGHRYGENSSQYTNMIVDVDQWLGKIVNKLKEWGIYEETYVYVTTDHGFDEGADKHSNAPYGFLATDDNYLTRAGDRRDIAPTILKRYGLSLKHQGTIPAVDGYPLDSIPDIACISEGEAYLDYPDAPQCCDDLDLIGLDKTKKSRCKPATGGTGDKSGYCIKCGDGKCIEPENRCYCPEDCTGAEVTGFNELNGMPVVGRRVILKQLMEPEQKTKTDDIGRYGFENVVSGNRFKVTIEGPKVQLAGAIVSGEIRLEGSPLVGMKIILRQPSEPKVQTKTDSDGGYQFLDVVGDKTFKVIIKGPKVP